MIFPYINNPVSNIKFETPIIFELPKRIGSYDYQNQESEVITIIGNILQIKGFVKSSITKGRNTYIDKNPYIIEVLNDSRLWFFDTGRCLDCIYNATAHYFSIKPYNSESETEYDIINFLLNPVEMNKLETADLNDNSRRGEYAKSENQCMITFQPLNEIDNLVYAICLGINKIDNTLNQCFDMRALTAAYNINKETRISGVNFDKFAIYKIALQIFRFKLNDYLNFNKKDGLKFTDQKKQDFINDIFKKNKEYKNPDPYVMNFIKYLNYFFNKKNRDQIIIKIKDLIKEEYIIKKFIFLEDKSGKNLNIFFQNNFNEYYNLITKKIWEYSDLKKILENSKYKTIQIWHDNFKFEDIIDVIDGKFNQFINYKNLVENFNKGIEGGNIIKSNEKLKINKIEDYIYIGPKGGKYIKINDRYKCLKMAKK